jgi:DNA processing protein
MLHDFPIKQLDKKDFPLPLLEIPQPPDALYIRGQLPHKDFKRLCVVGSRKYSTYGKDVCEKLIEGLRGYPVAIVSGLALGIDSIAHESALRAELPNIGVPGSGLGEDVLYPRSNTGLAFDILRHNGCLLSEFEEHFKATNYSFPQRNRIMAGLSDAVLIIEAEIKSGTLITAKLATDYNRDVLTVPQNIFSSTSEGPTMLLRLGATPIATSADILEALHIEIKDKEFKTKSLFIDLSDDEKTLVEALHSPLSRDEIISAIGWDVSKLAQIMTLLEIKGVIKESGGKVYLA